MKREKAEKAYERMAKYLTEMGGMNSMLFFNEKGKNAWVDVYKNAKVEKLDANSRIWFIEDEEEFERQYKDLIKQTKYATNLNMKVIEKLW